MKKPSMKSSSNRCSPNPLRTANTHDRPILDDLRTAKLDDRVIVLAFSEFGRRVAENDSQGTDHRVAGPLFNQTRRVAYMGDGARFSTPDQSFGVCQLDSSSRSSNSANDEITRSGW